MHYHLIVHPESLEYNIKNPISVGEKQQQLAIKAKEVISQLLTNEKAYVLNIPNSIDPRNIPKEIKTGDKVTIYGGRLGMCLVTTLTALRSKGITADFHPNGCI